MMFPPEAIGVASLHRTRTPTRQDAMRSLQFMTAELERIDHDRFYHPCSRIQKRMEVWRLAAHGLPQTEIA